MLHRRPQEPVRHEPDRALEIEGRWSTFGCWDHEVVFWPGHFSIQLSDLDFEEVVSALEVGVQMFLPLAQAEAGECLGYGVGYAAEDLWMG